MTGRSVFLSASLSVGFSVAAAQEPPPTVRDVQLDSVSRRVESFTPPSGPPGTAVTIKTGRLPAVTPLRIGIGATHFGFEEIGQVMTDAWGDFTISVRVPAWAVRDVTYRFIVFDFYFRPIALSDGFHVTDPEGRVVRKGRIDALAAECPMLRGDDEVDYALVGDLRGFAAGEHVAVEGKIGASSVCPGKTAIAIVRIQAVGENR